MIDTKAAHLRNLSARHRRVELEAHYLALKGMNGSDPVGAVAFTCGFSEGATVYANRFLTGIFTDFPELQKLFPDYANQFGPYEDGRT